MEYRDWNQGGPGLPFHLQDAVEAQVVPVDRLVDVAPLGTRRHQVLTELVVRYQQDGHVPEIWHGVSVVSTGEGTARVRFVLVRCRNCDHRTTVRRVLPRARYRGERCEPITADEVVRRLRETERTGIVVLLRVLGVLVLLMAGAGVLVVAENGVTTSRVVIVVGVFLLGATLLFGARDRARQPLGGDGRLPAWRTGWVRFGVGLVVAMLLAAFVGTPPPREPGRLRVDTVADPAHPSAPRCPVLPAGETIWAFDVAAPATGFGGAGGNGAGRFLDEAGTVYQCTADLHPGRMVVSVTCVPLGEGPPIGFGVAAPAGVPHDGAPTSSRGRRSRSWVDEDAGLVGAASEGTGLVVEVVADGVHLPGISDADHERGIELADHLVRHGLLADHIGCDDA